MSTLSESDLKELKELINSRFDEVNSRFDKVETQVNEVKTEIAAIDKKLDVYMAKTDERLNSIKQNLEDLKKQSDKQDNRLWLLISALFTTLLGAIAKITFFPNP